MSKAISSGLLILLVCISAANGCLTFYQDYGTTSNSFVLCDSNNVPASFNDKVSTIVVPPGWRATLYRDYNYAGPSLDIGEGVYNADASWNDQLSSVRIYPGCPVFFEHYDFKGSFFVLCKSGDVPSVGSWNDRVSSVYVPPNWSLILFRDYGYAGPSITMNAGAQNVPASFNDQLSSVQFTKSCPSFYQDYNLGGPSFVSCVTENAPNGWNDRVSSIFVPGGWRLTLFRDYNFAGPSLVANPGIWSAPSSFNDQLSSWRVDAKN